jgi:hypothetical protein
LLGLSADVHIRVCAFGATDIVKTLTEVPDIALQGRSIAGLQQHLREHGLWWTDNPADDSIDQNRWSHWARIRWPSHSIKIPVNVTSGKPFGPFFARHNKEPWYESVPGVSTQFDTKRETLPMDSLVIYLPLVFDTMSWRLTSDKYPNHWSSRVGKPLRPVTSILDALTRPKGFEASKSRKQKRFFMCTVNSHCAGPGAYLSSVILRELFAFTVYETLKQPVHAMGMCPIFSRQRLGPMDSLANDYRITSAVEIMSLHKFSITFENSATLGYITEKVANAYLAESIPIYFGPPRAQIEQVLNTKAFIHCDLPRNVTDADHLRSIATRACTSDKMSNACFLEFSRLVEEELKGELQHCARKVQELDSDDEKYDAMLAEPLIPLNPDGQPKGIWDPRELGKLIRVAMTAFEYTE